jgi:hypothetical protein
LLPRLGDVLFLSIFIGVIGFGPRLMNIDGDLGRHLTIGEFILSNQQIPTSDSFSHTMFGEPLTPHEWLTQSIFAIFHRIAGLDGVVWFCAVLIATTFIFLYKRCHQVTQMPLISIGVVFIAAAASSFHWLARPHLLTMLLIGVWTNEVDKLRIGKNTSWWRLPLMMFLWVNLHGAFIAGFMVLGMYILGELLDTWYYKGDISPGMQQGYQKLVSLRPLLIGGLSSFLATLVNPVGLRIWETSVGYIRNRYLVDHTAEYFSPNFHNPYTWPFLVMIALTLFTLGLRRSKLSFTSLLLIVGWTAMSLYSVRNVPLYAILVTPIIAELMKEIITGDWFYQLQKRILGVEKTLRGAFWPVFMVIIIGIILMIGIPLDFQVKGNIFLPEVFPINAVEWVEENPIDGKLFNYFPWGGYLLYRWWPDQQVFIDGQTDFYGEELTRQYEEVILAGEEWEEIVEYYQVDWMILPPDIILVRELNTNPEWISFYEDQTAVVFIRTGDN